MSAGRIKLCITSALFLLVTLLKLSSPAMAQTLRQTVTPAISADIDYRAAFAGLGDSLSELSAEAAEALLSLRGERARPALSGETAEPCGPAEPTALELRTRADSLSPELPERLSEYAASRLALESERAEAVSVFLASQSAYSDYAVPANVSYDAPELPFTHALPVSSGASSGFGFRLHPISGTVKFHYGTDFAADHGDGIYAFADGEVYAAYEEATYGKLVMIDHGRGWMTLYAHCSELLVTGGQSVSGGDLIALVGETGNATGPHLHFELTRDGVYYNPDFYMIAA